jgi:hypothetical protein
LTLPGGFCIVAARLTSKMELLKDSRERAMQLYSSYFAFTYRYPFAGERAGETRADDTSN